jgi:hypothetical protein
METVRSSVILTNFSQTTRSHIPEDSVMDLINALPGNRSVNTVQHATIEEALFSVDPTDSPIDWLDSAHVICVYCRSVSVPQLYNESREPIGSGSAEGTRSQPVKT